jgi:hypothetical protein
LIPDTWELVDEVSPSVTKILGEFGILIGGVTPACSMEDHVEQNDSERPDIGWGRSVRGANMAISTFCSSA